MESKIQDFIYNYGKSTNLVTENIFFINLEKYIFSKYKYFI